MNDKAAQKYINEEKRKETAAGRVPVDDAALVNVVQRRDELPREVARARLRQPVIGRAVDAQELGVVAAGQNFQHQTVQRFRLHMATRVGRAPVLPCPLTVPATFEIAYAKWRRTGWRRTGRVQWLGWRAFTRLILNTHACNGVTK